MTLPADPIAEAHGWKLVHGSGYPTEPGAQKLGQLFIDFFPHAAASLAQTMPLPKGCTGVVVLGGSDEADDWNVSESAIGFHAVLARVPAEDEGDEDEYDINEHNMAVVVLDTLFETMREDIVDNSAMVSALMTMPHEMAHVVAWLVASNGRTPLEVFDQGEGELAIKAMLEKIEGQAHGRGADEGTHGHAEDEAEEVARTIAESFALQADRSPAWMEALQAVNCKASRGLRR